MAPILKLDGYDLAAHMRLQPGEGMDPAGREFLQPQFADTAAGEGSPLISIGESNRELAFPLTLHPGKAGYAGTKDGLHQFVVDLERRIQALAVLEWRDDGATKSSFLDVVSARLDVDYHYRRAQHQWLQAVLRVWTKPFAHTATMRVLGTGAASYRPAPAPVVASGLEGDAAADVDVSVTFLSPVGSYTPSGVLFAGYAVLSQPEADIWVPPGATALNFNFFGSLAAASGAVASQMLTANLTTVTPDNALFRVFSASAQVNNVAYWPATGGIRALALLRNRAATTAHIFTRGAASAPIGPTQSIPAGHQWRVVDLGTIRDDLYLDVYAGVPGVASAPFDVGGMLMLPEQRTVAVAHSNTYVFGNAPVATHFFGTASGGIALRQWGATNTSSVYNVDAMARYTKAAGDGRLVTHASRPECIQAFAIPDDGAQNNTVRAEVRVREKFTYHR